MADMVAQSCKLIEAAVPQTLGYISFHTLQLPQHLNESLGVAMVDLFEQLMGIDSFQASTSFDQQSARHLWGG